MTDRAPAPRNRRDIIYFAVNFVLFLIVTGSLFYANRDILFTGYDGSYMRQLIAEAFKLDKPLFSLAATMLQGFGDIAFPVQFKLSPAALIGHAFGIETGLGMAAYYTTVGAEIFLASYLCSRLLGLGRGGAALVGWAAALASLPALPFTLLYPVATIVPYLMEQVAHGTFGIAIIIFLTRFKALSSLKAAAFVILLALTYYHIAYATITVYLSLVWMAAAFVGLNCARANRAWMSQPLPALTALASLVLLATTAVPFLIGLGVNTVPAFFSSELISNRPKLEFISIIYYGPIGQGWFNTVAYVIGISACIYLSFRDERPGVRGLAASIIVYSLCLQALGLMILFVFTEYSGIWPLYFEWQIWPFLFLFTTIAAARLCRLYAPSAMQRMARLKPSPRIATVLGTVPAALFLALAVSTNTQPSERVTPFPPHETALTRTLEDKIGIFPDRSWRGSLLNITGAYPRPGNGKVTWNNQNHLDAKFTHAHGTDYRAWGMWWHGIPTAFTYNQGMSPILYAFLTRAFASTNDLQQRSVLILTQPNIHAMRIVGARYLLSERPIPEQPDLVLIGRYSTTPETQFSGQQEHYFGFDNQYLYEVKGANTEGVAPRTLIPAPTAAKALDILLSPDFDPARSAVLTGAFIGQLGKVQEISTRIKDGIVNVRVEAEGQNLVVLPLLFSNCLEIEGAGTETRLIRANMLQTGVVVRGSANFRISFRNGPVLSPYCKIQDWKDAISMKLGDLWR